MPAFRAFLTRHRRAREASILHRLAKGEADIPTMVRAIYIGLDLRLTGAAGYSVLAHLEDLVARGIVVTDGDPVIGGPYWRLWRMQITSDEGRCERIPIRYSLFAIRPLHFFTVLAGLCRRRLLLTPPAWRCRPRR